MPSQPFGATATRKSAFIDAVLDSDDLSDDMRRVLLVMASHADTTAAS